MTLIYPEKWPGWLEHARHGWSLFDGPEIFLNIVEECWKYHISLPQPELAFNLDNPPIVRIFFNEDLKQLPEWKKYIDYLGEHFHPQFRDVELKLQIEFAQNTSTINQLEFSRNFCFQIYSVHKQSLRCFFFLGSQRIGSLNIPDIDLSGEWRNFDIYRKLRIFTQGSLISKCYQDSPYWEDLPDEMCEDLKHLGWRLHFYTEMGQINVRFEDLPDPDECEGGDLLLRNGQVIKIGDVVDFYIGWRETYLTENRIYKAEDLRCRLLLLPADIQPRPSEIRDVELFLHRDFDGIQTPTLEVFIWLQGEVMQDNRLQLKIDSHKQKILSFSGSREIAKDLHVFRGEFEICDFLTSGQKVRCTPIGTNRYGLVFAPTNTREVEVREAIAITWRGSQVISRQQLKQDWEISFEVKEYPHQTLFFDLNDLKLRIQGIDSSKPDPLNIAIPLATISETKLGFRYLYNFVRSQIDVNAFAQSEYLAMWVEQTDRAITPTDPSMPCRLSSLHNTLQDSAILDCPADLIPKSRLSSLHNTYSRPLTILRLVDLDQFSQFLPPVQTISTSPEMEIVAEGVRFQAIGPLSLTSAEHEAAEIWDILLFDLHTNPRQIHLLHRGENLMQIQHANTTVPSGNEMIRSLWLSGPHSDHKISDPRERNPAGGPCWTFGLALNKQTELAQLRPSADGFRIYRHRQNVQVCLNGKLLDTEPYANANGTLLSSEFKHGWLAIDRALLQYRLSALNEGLCLSLTHIGYLVRHSSSIQGVMQIELGAATAESNNTSEQADIPIISLQRDAKHTILTLNHLPSHLLPNSYPPLQIQALQGDTLPSPLNFGQTYKYPHLDLKIWKMMDVKSGQIPQHAELPELPMLLEVQSMYGRIRYALCRLHGHLGYLYEGSHYISDTNRAEAMPTPEHKRTTPDGYEIPPHTLLLGHDINHVDILLPSNFPIRHKLPFALALRGDDLHIYPLQADCALFEWHQGNDGQLLYKEPVPNEHQSLSIKLHPKSRYFFRCDNVLFEASTHPNELEQLKGADIALSIRGIFQSARQTFAIGGRSDITALPICDPIQSHPLDLPLYRVFAPSLKLCYRGDGVVGLRQSSPQPSLRTQFLRDLAEHTPRIPSHPKPSHPMHVFATLLESPQIPEQLPKPVLLNEREDLALPPYFLRESMLLDIEGLKLRYLLRDDEYACPPPYLVPAMLLLEPTQQVFIPFADDPEFFLAPRSLSAQIPIDEQLVGLTNENNSPIPAISQIIIGRPDHTDIPPRVVNAEIFCGQPYDDGTGLLVSKISLFGHLPRNAAQLRRNNHGVWLDIPAPSHQTPYHVVIEDRPINAAESYLIERESKFHINHLLVCRITPHPKGLIFALCGYLLGHQRDPSKKVIIAKKNHVGCLHLHSIAYDAQIALLRTPCPPHFSYYLQPEQEHSATTQMAPIYQFADEEACITLSLGPFEIADGCNIGLVDLQHASFKHPAFTRPTDCDRLLWWKYATDSTTRYLFPPTSIPIESADAEQTSQAASLSTSIEPISEHFQIEESIYSEGSSFSFDDDEDTEPIHDCANTVPPITPVSLSHQGDTFDLRFDSDDHQLNIGWRCDHDCDEHFFGYIAPGGGSLAMLYMERGKWLLKPTYEAPPTHPDLPPLALWHRGQWASLCSAREICAETTLLCDTAAFSISITHTSSVSICRKWLWLPNHKIVRLTGMVQADMPSSDADAVFALSELDQAEICCIYPMQRGHSVETKGGLPLHLTRKAIRIGNYS